MNDKPYDAHTLTTLEWQIENRAFDLKMAIKHVKKHGLDVDIEQHANDMLKGSGYKLVKDDKK